MDLPYILYTLENTRIPEPAISAGSCLETLQIRCVSHTFDFAIFSAVINCHSSDRKFRRGRPFFIVFHALYFAVFPLWAHSSAGAFVDYFLPFSLVSFSFAPVRLFIPSSVSLSFSLVAQLSHSLLQARPCPGCCLPRAAGWIALPSGADRK